MTGEEDSVELELFVLLPNLNLFQK